MMQINKTARRVVCIRKTDNTLAIAIEGEINMQNKITLEIEVPGQIIAKFSGPHSEHVQKLFNGTRIPTPWTFADVKEVEHFGAKVITAIREKNPGVEVNWSDERCEQFTAFKFLQLAKVGC
jgi:hypothetical protein